METGSILIKGKRKRFTKRQTGCLKCFGAQALKLRRLKEFIEVYIDNKVYLLSYNFFKINLRPKKFYNIGSKNTLFDKVAST